MPDEPTVADWQRAWPGCRPIGYELRSCAPDRWVRLHSLPGSKRYADTDAEYAELLSRHRTVLLELAPATNAQLYVVTYSWSDSPVVVPRDAKLDRLMPAAYWGTSFIVDEEDPESAWVHLFISSCTAADTRLNELLRLTADDAIGSPVMFDNTLAWLYHPYDGGADVLLPGSAHRDRLRDRHTDWLSSHPLGL